MSRIPRRSLWALLLLALFLVVVLTMIFTYVYAGAGGDGVLGFFMANHFVIMLLVSVGGLAVGGIVYWLMGEEVGEVEQESEANAKLLLSLLPPAERQVVEFLVRGGGNGLQSEIARLQGMNRLRAHRVIADLKHRGIVHVEAIGKLNKVFLSASLVATLRPGTEPAKPTLAVA